MARSGPPPVGPRRFLDDLKRQGCKVIMRPQVSPDEPDCIVCEVRAGGRNAPHVTLYFDAETERFLYAYHDDAQIRTMVGVRRVLGVV